MTQVEGYHLLPVPAGWAAVQVSSAVVLIVLIKPLRLHILALSSKLSLDTVSFTENVPQEIFARG